MSELDEHDEARRTTGSRRRVLRVIAVVGLTLALVVGVSTALLYRHFDGNLDPVAMPEDYAGRPDAVDVAGDGQPLDVLVMGSDTRDGADNDIDGLSGGGERSDTTILFHLSADRKRAYGVSIPRDSLIDRPDCETADGDIVPGAARAMWNEAFAVGGAACTVQQFERLTGIRLDHFVVVDFTGFRDMVDAVGGVQVCLPEPVDDAEHGISLAAGTQVLQGDDALAYVRERHALSGGSDLGRIKRQQAFVASMITQVVSSGTLARPDRLVGFLDAATKSLHPDEDLSLYGLTKLGHELRDIGLDDIEFITVPYAVDDTDPNRLVWTPDADTVWQRLLHDQVLTPSQTGDAIAAAGVGAGAGAGAGAGDAGDATPGDPGAQSSAAAAGLCA